MTLTATLVGQFLKFVDSNNTKPEFEFPLLNTSTLFDDGASAMELCHGKNRLYFTAADLASPVCADYAALKVQMAAWKAEAKVVTLKTQSETNFQTAAIGTNYVVLPNVAALGIMIYNDSGATIQVKRGSLADTIKCFTGTYLVIDGITNTNQLSVKRLDGSNTQLTVVYSILN